MRLRAIKRPNLWLLGFALLLLLGGAQGSGRDVKCGDSTMSPGEQCTTYHDYPRNTNPVTRSYDEQRSQQHFLGHVMLFGSLVVGIGSVLLGPRRPVVDNSADPSDPTDGDRWA